ncbi:protein IQ-DOMAIN 12-like isoform X1 [Miscanthus floridulus]|uniref:protein IQ-DOMAIN 12-like isoform X1 n=1 Tax=Miscanthus floridulus TaxID=154761 RepID=UPI0034581847
MDKEKRRRSWFERIRRLFTSSDPKPTPKPADKKAKSKRWLPGKLRAQQSFALPPPAPAGADQIRQAEDEQSKHAVAVALATAAAAEAAVAAAHAAAHVVRLTGQPPPVAHVPRQVQVQEQEHAAVAIQSAYRGYLARRALRALKGLVRLQALIRGQAVRRQTAATLRGLESLMRIQARHRSRAGGVDHHQHNHQAADDDAQLLRRGRELFAAAAAVHEQQQQQASNKGWDSSIFSKEEMSAMTRSKEEAALKRVRALQYASLHNEKLGLGLRRPPSISMSRDEVDALNQRWSWLEEWVGSQPPFDKDVPVAHQSPYTSTTTRGEDATANKGDDVVDRLGCSARRSFARLRSTPGRGDCYYDDDAAAACSPAPFPGYMASTASAKAKFRSMSTPKERSAAAYSDAYSEHCFPYADRLLSPIPSMSPIPSVASDMGFARSTRPPVAQRSPRVAAKSPMTPVRSRSRRSPGHHSFGSEAALHQLQMEHYTPVR